MSTDNSTPDSTTGSLHDFVTFKWFVTPVIIQVVFWLMVLSVVGYSLFTFVSGIVLMFGDFEGSFLAGALVCLTSIAMFVGGLISVRIYCELIILAFRVYDRLGVIAQKLER
jgi:hypothetical protein